MKKNLGTTDRILRLVISLSIAILYFTGVISGTLAIALLVLAVIFIFTSFVGFCPLYFPFGIKTRKEEKSNT